MHSMHTLLRVFDSISEGGPSLYREFIDATSRQFSESSLPGSGSPIVGAPSSGSHEPYRKPVTPTTPSIGINTESSSPPKWNPLLKCVAPLRLPRPPKPWHRGTWSGMCTGDTGILAIDLFSSPQEVDPSSLAFVVASEMAVYDTVCLLIHVRNRGICRFVPRGCTIGVCASGEEAETFLRCLFGAVE